MTSELESGYKTDNQRGRLYPSTMRRPGLNVSQPMFKNTLCDVLLVLGLWYQVRRDSGSR